MASKKDVSQVVPEPLPQHYTRPAQTGFSPSIIPAEGFVITRVGNHKYLMGIAEADGGRKLVKKGSGYVLNEDVCDVDEAGRLMITGMFLYAESEQHYKERKAIEDADAFGPMRHIVSSVQSSVQAAGGLGNDAPVDGVATFTESTLGSMAERAGLVVADLSAGVMAPQLGSDGSAMAAGSPETKEGGIPPQVPTGGTIAG